MSKPLRKEDAAAVGNQQDDGDQKLASALSTMSPSEDATTTATLTTTSSTKWTPHGAHEGRAVGPSVARSHPEDQEDSGGRHHKRQKTTEDNNTTNMGHLAQFVAATIRDKVVQEQQVEISDLQTTVGELRGNVAQLQRRLQESNPHRPIRLVHGTTGAVLLQCEIHAEEIGHVDQVPLFLDHGSSRHAGGDEAPSDVVLKLGEFLDARLCIDEEFVMNRSGRSAPRPVPALTLRDLEFVTVHLKRCPFLPETSNCHIRGTHGHLDVTILFYVGPLTVQQYCQWTGVTSPDDELVPNPTDLLGDGQPKYLDTVERPIAVEHLANAARLTDKHVKIFLPYSVPRGEGLQTPSVQCSADFIFEHLHVPYAP